MTSVGVGESVCVCVVCWTEFAWDRRGGSVFNRHTTGAVLVGQDGRDGATDVGVAGRMNDRREAGDLLS